MTRSSHTRSLLPSQLFPLNCSPFPGQLAGSCCVEVDKRGSSKAQNSVSLFLVKGLDLACNVTLWMPLEPRHFWACVNRIFFPEGLSLDLCLGCALHPSQTDLLISSVQFQVPALQSIGLLVFARGKVTRIFLMWAKMDISPLPS